MNPLQTGTPSSQLSPQGYRNSTQKGSVQSTLNSSNVQSSTDDALRAPASGKLKVVVPQNTTVLGTSDANTTTVQTTNDNVGGVSSIVVVVLIGSAVLTVYFFKRFRKFLRVEPEENDQD